MTKLIENSNISRKANILEQRINKCEVEIINLSKISKESLNGIENINTQYTTLNTQYTILNTQMSWCTESNMNKMLAESQTAFSHPQRMLQHYPNYDYLGHNPIQMKEI